MRIFLIVVICIMVLYVNISISCEIPERAKVYLPVLKGIVDKDWYSLYKKYILAGQIEQETCITLRHKNCWNPKAELKTIREYGFGFGQLTVTKKFDTFKEVKGYNKELQNWKWENRFDPYFQLKAFVAKDKFTYGVFKYIKDADERLAMTLAAYNGGIGGVLNDRKVCTRIIGCDKDKWFNNVEKYSTKSKVVTSGYGKSFFQINREYVRNIFFKRSFKYIKYMGD